MVLMYNGFQNIQKCADNETCAQNCLIILRSSEDTALYLESSSYVGTCKFS